MRYAISPVCTLMIVAAFLASIPADAQSPTPQETLNQYVADLQRTPNDIALRERIIKLAQNMSPAPAIPEAAREHYVMAATFVEMAKDTSGYERAIEQYKAALFVAPWWADAYKKLAIAQKAVARYDDAIWSLGVYLLAQPADARDAQDEIYKLKALKQTATAAQAQIQGASAPQPAPAPPPNPFEALLKKIDGRRYTCEESYDNSYTSVIDVKGRVLVLGMIMRKDRGYQELGGNGRFEIRGRASTYPLPRPVQQIAPVWSVEITFILADEGDRITRRVRFSDGDFREHIFLWQR